MSNARPLKDMAISTSGNGGEGLEERQVRSDDYKEVVVRYKECLKNHAAAIGGNATDGCGEFMPNGEEGSLEALMCSACSCHMNFHRKEMECGCTSDCCHRKLILGPHDYFSRSPHGDPSPHRAVIMSFKGGSIPSETDEKDEGRIVTKARKRFRTKFSQEQKEKMLSFAEKAEWRIQKLDESVVQQFCQEIGIKRRVLKVWMHNNKQSFAKKNNVSAA
ncbi:Zinc-finger homeodomain protein 4 [Hibiscus syriacus]|uniref:Zinc-finger homeodomain protein 4 n=2 Tax=Hibiscus syriacus TaxID=106335 RepID=A0A6A3CDW4_HIBSY|nr:Zinc-finger homeodomain protein 4 [Hibiscus syriacus]